MTAFIETENGWVNLAFVREIKTGHRRNNDPYRYILIDTEGHTHVAVRGSYTEWADLTAPLLPAAPDARATVIHVFGEKRRPAAEDIHMRELPIVGWRVTRFGCEPIFLEPEDDGEGTVLIHGPDGKFVELAVGTHKDLEEAKAAVLHYHQQAWDRSNKAPAEPL